MEHINGFKAAVAAVVGCLTALWGWFGWVVLAWVALMLADWLVGSAVAAKEGCWSSAKMREGAWHKGGMLLVVCVALTADWLVGSILGNLPGVTLPFTYSVLIGPLVIVWYIIGDLGSLAEHAVAMGAAILDGVIGLILANIPALELPFRYEVFASVLVLVWYIMTELGSIVENVGALGAPVPAWLRKAIAALESTVDGAGDKLGSGQDDEK